MTFIFMAEFAMDTFTDTSQKNGFDPLVASERLSVAADYTKEYAGRGPSFYEKCFKEATDELRAAHLWLLQNRTPFDATGRQTVLQAADEGAVVDVDLLVETLQGTSLEVLQVYRLLELRGGRRKP